MSMKKLALVTAMFAATSGAFAMEALDEEALAATTGQDGITIGINTQATLDVILHDKNGFTSATSAGAIYLDNIGLGHDSDANGVIDADAQLRINIDAGHDGAATTAGASLNINVSSLNSVMLDLGALSVSESTGYAAGTTVAGATILDLGTLSIGAGTLLNIQLGHEYQGNLIDINTTLSGGLTLTGFAINDVSGTQTGGTIHVDALKVTNSTGATADLTVDLGIDATTSGLAITVGTLGTGGLRVTLDDVRLGATATASTNASIGDVEIRGLDLTNDVITISGH